MTNRVVAIRNRITGASYKYIAKPIFFRCDPESVHDAVTSFAAHAGNLPLFKTATRLLFDYQNPMLSQHILGMHFVNPVGLSAGFDKNGQLTHIVPAVGFGFLEIGSVTGEPCDGNPKPRLWRLKDQQSLVVWYGLKNDGAQVIANRLRAKKVTVPCGISLAKTNSPATTIDTVGIADYAKVAAAFHSIGDYFTVNISCPNTYGGEPFTDPRRLGALLDTLDRYMSNKPTFVKLPPDLPHAHLLRLLEVCKDHNIDGFISTNLTKRRDMPELKNINVPTYGGLSGKLVQAASDQQIATIYRHFAGSKVIIGVGGVFTAADAYRKIKAGASLVQLITGMIYLGPQTVSDINHGLVSLLHQDGYDTIADAIGADYR